MKIRFNQPRYMIPLIIFPFSLLIFYVLKDSFGHQKQSKETELEQMQAINPNLPDPNLDKRPVKDKFSSFLEVYKHQHNNSALQTIERQEQADSSEVLPGTDFEEVRFYDSLAESIINSKTTAINQQQTTRANSKLKAKSSRSKSMERAHQQELELFRQQMLLLDSLSKTPAERTAEQQAKWWQENMDKLLKKDETPAPLPVQKAERPALHFFNTISQKPRELMIRAIVDENIKVSQGSRVRIRLLDDVVIQGQWLPAGLYLYGIVSGFQPQRLEISISSVVVEDQIFPVDLSIYDTDGLKGLYVPASDFRQFRQQLTGQLATNPQVNFGNDPNQLNQMLFNLADRTVQTSGQALGRAARKNKAHIKYNSMVYLVNQEDLKTLIR